MADLCVQPRSGADYAVEVGSSFSNAAASTRPFCSLRYDFQPASVSRSKPGVLQQHGGSSKVSLYLANNNNGELDVLFSGKFEQAKDDLDVIAIFDGNSFRLEQLCGQIKTRYNRDSAAYGGSGSQPCAPNRESTSSMDELFPSDDGEEDAGPSGPSQSALPPNSMPAASHQQQQQQQQRKRAPGMHQDAADARLGKRQPSQQAVAGRSTAGRPEARAPSTSPQLDEGEDEDELGAALDAEWEDVEDGGAPGVKGQVQGGQQGGRGAAAAVALQRQREQQQQREREQQQQREREQREQQQREQREQQQREREQREREQREQQQREQQQREQQQREQQQRQKEQQARERERQLQEQKQREQQQQQAREQQRQQQQQQAQQQQQEKLQQQQQKQQQQQQQQRAAQARPGDPKAKAKAEQAAATTVAGSGGKAQGSQPAAAAAARPAPPKPAAKAKSAASHAFDTMNPLEAAWAQNVDEEEEDEEEEEEEEEEEAGHRAAPQPQAGRAAAAAPPAAAGHHAVEDEDEEGDEDDDDGDANKCSDDESLGGTEYF